jgi:hypothetical protein
MAAALDNCGNVRIRTATMAAWVKSGSEMRRARACERGGALVRCLTAFRAPQAESIRQALAAAGKNLFARNGSGICPDRND